LTCGSGCHVSILTKLYEICHRCVTDRWVALPSLTCGSGCHISILTKSLLLKRMNSREKLGTSFCRSSVRPPRAFALPTPRSPCHLHFYPSVGRPRDTICTPPSSFSSPPPPPPPSTPSVRPSPPHGLCRPSMSDPRRSPGMPMARATPSPLPFTASPKP
jgi:hypothetical protein